MFYNPIQQFNRDLSVLAIKAYGEDACQRKRQRHEMQQEKNNRKRHKKQKRQQEVADNHEANGDDGAELSTARKRKRDDIVDDNKDDVDGQSPSKRSQEWGDFSTNNQDGQVHLQKGQKRKREDGLDGESAAEDARAKFQKVEDSSAADRNGTSTAGHAQGILDAPQHGKGLRTTEDVSASDAQSRPVENGGSTEQHDAVKPERETDTKGGAEGEEATVTNQTAPQQPWRPRFRILDALSATGLRALRYATEIPFATAVVANDRDRNAVRSIETNVAHNNLTSAITTVTGDALAHMYGVAFPAAHTHGPHHLSGKYDVIDLDPYGTAAPFIDAALQALDDGGLLCVTCTDSGVFASCGYSEKTFSLYGGMPIKGTHSHEGGLRLILHSIATSASKYGIAIEPLLSLSIDFYARLFIRVRKSPADVKFLAGKTMLVYGCDHGCGAWVTQFLGRHMRHKGSDTNWKYSIAQGPGVDQHCEHCGSKMHIAGPMWAGPLHNPAFIEKVLDDLVTANTEIYQTEPRIEGMLATALDELAVNSDTMDFRSLTASSPDGTREMIPKVPPEALDHHPFFFIPSALCKVIKAVAPPEHLVKGALRHAGYRATRSHCKPGSIKTDAPWTAIWEIMREWVRQRSPIKEGALKEGTAGWRILQATREQDDNAEATGEGAANDTAETTPNVVTEVPNSDTTHEEPAIPKRMKVVFDEKLGKDKPGKRLVRYQQNPRENWGPMTKAKGSA